MTISGDDTEPVRRSCASTSKRIGVRPGPLLKSRSPFHIRLNKRLSHALDVEKIPLLANKFFDDLGTGCFEAIDGKARENYQIG